MIGTVVNALAVLLGSALGLLGGARLRPERTEILVHGLAIVILVLGISPAVATGDILALILCLVLGSALGEALDIERRLDRLGEFLKARLLRGGGRGGFTEGFVTASLVMCVGSMAVMGSLEAGIRGNPALLYSKAVIDGVLALSFSAALGIGVAFAALPLFLYQGTLTLLAGLLAPYLSDTVVREMSAVGGILLIGTGLNTLGLMPRRIRVGNMLPAILLPILYVPLAEGLASLF